jgi:hypothetical protein
MLNIYEFPAEAASPTDDGYPKAFRVDYVRGYRTMGR